MNDREKLVCVARTGAQVQGPSWPSRAHCAPISSPGFEAFPPNDVGLDALLSCLGCLCRRSQDQLNGRDSHQSRRTKIVPPIADPMAEVAVDAVELLRSTPQQPLEGRFATVTCVWHIAARPSQSLFEVRCIKKPGHLRAHPFFRRT